MKRKDTVFILMLSLTLMLSTLCRPLPAKASQSDPILKIGLYYAGTALPSANLENNIGSGYRFGYFDAQRAFVALGQTQQSAITMMKDANFYLASDQSYTTGKTGGGTIGAYHVQLAASYGDFASAQAAAQAAGGFVYISGGRYAVRVGSYETLAQAQAAGGGVAVGAEANTVTVTLTKSAKILLEFDASDTPLGVMPISDGEKAKTWFKGYKYYGGMEYRREGSNLAVINVVGMQDYIKGVLPYEMSASWPLEALKAQACCARSYAYGNLNKHQSYGFDLCATTDCQVYRGTNSASATSDQAVDETIGEYITYKGKIATGFFHSSNGGSTENSENVWGSKVDYLRAVSDPYEDLDRALNGRWTSTIDNAGVAAILKSKGVNISSVSNVYVDERTAADNVYRLCVVDGSGKVYSYEKEKARTILNSSDFAVNSLRYRISGSDGANPGGESVYVNGQQVTSEGYYAVDGSGQAQAVTPSQSKAIDGSGQIVDIAASGSAKTAAPTGAGAYVFSGTGWGHSVGLSQYGAKGMAERGFAYDHILKFYYTGVELSRR